MKLILSLLKNKCTGEQVFDSITKLVEVKDSLTSIGESILDTKIICLVLNKQPKSFDNLVNTLTVRGQTCNMLFDTLYGHLL